MDNQNKLKHRRIGVGGLRSDVPQTFCQLSPRLQICSPLPTAVEREHCLPARHAHENLGRCPLKMLTLSADIGTLSDPLKATTGTQCLFPNADIFKSFRLLSTKQYG